MKNFKWAILVLNIALLTSCYPSYDKDIENYDVVVTSKLSNNFEADDGQSSFSSFFLADTIMHLADSLKEKHDPDFPREYDEYILTQVAQEFTDMGYTQIYDTLGAAPDVLISVSALAVQNTLVYSYYPGYWYGGGYWGSYWDEYWWGYPGYPYWPTYPIYTAYSFNKGTIYIDMVSYHPELENEEIIMEEWKGAINGLLYEGNSPSEERIGSNIELLFNKSPYLQVK